MEDVVVQRGTLTDNGAIAARAGRGCKADRGPRRVNVFVIPIVSVGSDQVAIEVTVCLLVIVANAVVEGLLRVLVHSERDTAVVTVSGALSGDWLA
jgi:hypothetical protein